MQLPSEYFQHETPPWLEHAPLPVAVLLVPSLQVAPVRVRVVEPDDPLPVRAREKSSVVFPVRTIWITVV